MIENLIPLNIFPEGSLANSVIVTVWVGVIVIAFFNLRFGWVLSGLVVPGYLVPLMLVKPVSVWVIIFEAWITYSVSLFLCNKAGSWFGLSHFFGRDRFFLLILVSVFVRLIMDAFFFPMATSYFQENWQIQLKFQNDLHSFGLIIISLIANQIWKTGFVRGNFHFFVTLFITFIVVKFLLIGLTNFSIANLSFMYEEITVAILASPKSYIILLLCCYLSSRMNLLYGWEYSGILIPSLIALQWYFPQKVLVTFLESFVILGLGALVLKIPRLANMDITGARKLVVFFSIGFLYKMVLAYFLEWNNPYDKVSDYFAFGYLLSTLIAIKIHDKNLFFHTSRAILQTSIMTVLFATVIGFILTQVKIPAFEKTLDINTEANLQYSDQDFDDWMLKAKVNLFEAKSSGYSTQPSISEIDQFSVALRHIDDAIKAQRDIPIKAQSLLNSVGYEIHELSQEIILYPQEKKTWGIYVFSKQEESIPLLVSAPRGMDEELAYDASYSMFKLLKARYMAISTSPFKSNEDGSADTLLNPSTSFSYFQKVLSNNSVLQVRTTKRDIESVAKKYSHLVNKAAESYLWIKGNLKQGIDFNFLSEMTKEPEVFWYEPDFFNQQRNSTKNGFMELLINQRVANRIKVMASNDANAVSEIKQDISIEGYLNALILEEKDFIAPKNSGLYSPPKANETLFFYQEILLPIIEIANNDSAFQKGNEDLQAINNINVLAQLFNYEITFYKYIRNDKEYLILKEKNNDSKRYWGTYVFSLHNPSKQIVQVPRPLMERGTFEYGQFLFNVLNAKVLMIAGSHPNTNQDNSSDVLSRFNTNSIFNTVHYAYFDTKRNEVAQAHQVRSMGYNMVAKNPGYDLVVSEENNIENQQIKQKLLAEISSLAESLGLNYLSDFNEQHLVGTKFTQNAIINQLRYQSNKQVITHWISPLLNQKLKQQEEQWLNYKQFKAMGWQTESRDIIKLIQSVDSSTIPLEQEIIQNLDAYIDSENIAFLLRLNTKSKYTFKVVSDEDSKQSFVVIYDRGSIVAIRNINAMTSSELNFRQENAINEFLTARHAWLTFRVEL